MHSIEERRRQIWARIAQVHPEFTPAHAAFDDHEMVDTLLADDYIGFTPFAGARVMDIGANQGILTAYWALNKCRVRAYEADPVTYQVLCTMLAATRLDAQVEAVQAAVWTCDGEIPFWGRGGTHQGIPYRNGAIQVASGGDHNLSAPAVPSVSLSTALGDQVWDAVKIDVEGAEWAMLLETPDEKLARIKHAHVELHHCWEVEDHYQAFLDKLDRTFRIEGYLDQVEGSVTRGRYHWIRLDRR